MSEEKEIDRRTSVEIPLDFPITIDGQAIASITMRRPKVRDSFKAKRVKGDDMDRGLALMADLCECPQEHLMELDEIDLEKLQSQYAAFTGRATNPES
jgi:hypothetical protein